MKGSTLVRLLAVVAVSGFSGALAAQYNGKNGKPERATRSALTPEVRSTSERMPTSDTLMLTGKQKSAAWSAIIEQARKQKPPPNFKAKVGTVMPNTLMTYPVPMTASDQVPSLRRYQYALLTNNKLLIIDPDDEKVAKVITH